MRKQLVKTVESLLETNERLVLLLGDIGVFGFREAFKKFSNRVYNIGILEDATISLASGLAKSDLIPIVHTIAPFLVERSFEQLKVDFGYQKLSGNFISVGASYDYAALGCTHHCPGDIGILQNIPGMQIISPGTSKEFDALFKQTYNNQAPTYTRLSERENPESFDVSFGKANLIKKGSKLTVLAFGPVLSYLSKIVESLDITLIYYSTLAPFDSDTLRKNITDNNKVLLIEPFYSGTMFRDVINACSPLSISIESIGVPRQFLTKYGTAEEHDSFVGLSEATISKKIQEMINNV
jgi:transketolase